MTPQGILLVSELFPPAVGGSAELLGNIYSRLEGVPTTVLTDRRPGEARVSQPFERIFERQMRAASWGVVNPKGLSHYLAVAGEIWRQTRRGIAAVHCGRVLPEGLAALLARAAGAPPYVCWAHGEELAYIDSSRELRRLAATVYNRARAVIANSQHTAEKLIARGVAPRAIHVVRPGVQADRFRPNPPGASELRRRLAPHGETVWLTVGRLQRRKGHDLVIDTLARMGRAARQVRYVIVGDGEERARLETLARERALGAVVRFAGKVSAEVLPQYYGAADIFVHPNRVDNGDFEGFGIVLLEAAACGLPVIGGNSGGVPEAVLDGVTGVLVSGTDSSELHSALTNLMTAPEKRRGMGEAGRSRVLADFTWQCAAHAVSDLHTRLVTQ